MTQKKDIIAKLYKLGDHKDKDTRDLVGSIIQDVKSLEEQEHNGWTNYATWRVNLEIIDGMDWATEIKEGNTHADIGGLKEYLKDSVNEIVFDVKQDTGLMEDYANAFLVDVNYHEIAQHVIEDYPKIIKN